MSTTSNNPSSGVEIFSGREQESYHRGRKNDSQRCDIIDTQRTSKQGVPIPNLFCSKEGWGVETHNEPEKAEHLCGDSPLQNGRHLHAEGYPQPRRLDDKNRPEGCLLYDSNGTTPQTSTEIPVAGENLPCNSIVSPSDYHLHLGSLPRP